MSLIVIGINHKTAPLSVRERFSFTKAQLERYLFELKKISAVSGAITLSTCNRMECYFHLADKITGQEEVKKFLFNYWQIQDKELKGYFYIFEDLAAVRNIFRVASGLDSQVLGETQILSQVRNAQVTAKQAGVTSVFLDELFLKAVEVVRIVRAKTKISQGNVSVAGLAIKKCEEYFGNLKGKIVLTIGAGKIGSILSKHLKEKKVHCVFVSNRTYKKASELAFECDGEAVTFSQISEKLKIVDIVISSTSSPHFVLKKDVLMKAMQIRKKPLLIIDLALPRDVDPEARNISNICLYNLDDLKSVIEENLAKRKKEAVLAEAIIQREVENFLHAKSTELLVLPYVDLGPIA